MSLEHAREIDTCKSEFVDGREGVVEIDDSKLGGFLTTDVSLCRGKRAGRVSKPRNRFRATSQMSIYLRYFVEVSNREEKWRLRGGGE